MNILQRCRIINDKKDEKEDKRRQKKTTRQFSNGIIEARNIKIQNEKDGERKQKEAKRTNSPRVKILL